MKRNETDFFVDTGIELNDRFQPIGGNSVIRDGETTEPSVQELHNLVDKLERDSDVVKIFLVYFESYVVFF